MSSDRDVPYGSMILVPGIVTLAVTLLRVTGERLGWSKTFFNPEPGGGAALVGIIWLVPIFGAIFALKLARMGHGPVGLGRALGRALGAFAVVAAVVFGMVGLRLPFLAQLVVFGAASLGGIVIAWNGWPTLAKTLLLYGLVARIPVTLVMLAAMLGDWKTHYDLPPPNSDFPAMGVMAKFFWIGLVPQMTVWLYVTLGLGMIAGAIACAAAGRKVAAPA